MESALGMSEGALKAGETLTYARNATSVRNRASSPRGYWRQQ